jgi:hypothetical protein
VNPVTLSYIFHPSGVKLVTFAGILVRSQAGPVLSLLDFIFTGLASGFNCAADCCLESNAVPSGLDRCQFEQAKNEAKIIRVNSIQLKIPLMYNCVVRFNRKLTPLSKWLIILKENYIS